MQTFVFLGFLINVAIIAAGGVVVIAVWYGMKALVKMADSVARMAASMEKMEETIRSREKECL
jgi:hypothetical protein